MSSWPARAVAARMMAKEKKAHGHQASANRLEKVAPRTEPKGAVAPKMENTMFFRRPGG